MPFHNRIAIASPTGALLNVYASYAEATPVGVVQINHGLAEHAGRYARLAERLVMYGFHAYAHDHRGHGSTTAAGAARGQFGRKDGGATVLADVTAILDLIETQHPGLPVVVFGHSMGGLIAMETLLRHARRIRAAAIWNINPGDAVSIAAARAMLAWERFRLGSDMPSRLMLRLTFRAWGRAIHNARTEFDWLSHDPVEVNKYIADPLCGWAPSVGMWRDIFEWMAHLAQDRAFDGVRRDIALHLTAGGEDPATRGGRATLRLAERLRRLGFTDVTFTAHPTARHEGLNDTDRNRTVDEFISWARRVVRN
ncbi:MAG: alpha/beta hydrolase [Rhizobiaceae bacterium]